MAVLNGLIVAGAAVSAFEGGKSIFRGKE